MDAAVAASFTLSVVRPQSWVLGEAVSGCRTSPNKIRCSWTTGSVRKPLVPRTTRPMSPVRLRTPRLAVPEPWRTVAHA